MNIKEAKTEILNTLRAYLRKDAQGNYLFPRLRQRPILLMGPPGIGKTAILQQAAREAGVGLAAYSMTHHTRQSAIGLPHIETRRCGDREMQVTEYTMSEIIGAVYAQMEKTGKKEGILFLDEINCVSETLAPAMLQLLQNKTFGSHAVPEGWVIVTAGNPPEYNKAVREFDIATLDRVRTIPVEADCGVWLEYAQAHGVHGAIQSYLAIRPEHFYRTEQHGEEKAFVTARGWEDLSEILKAYEALTVPVAGALVKEYLQEEEISSAFAAYYQLYRKYDTDYAIPELLDGSATEKIWNEKVQMARSGGFEERFTVIQLLMEGLGGWFARWKNREEHVRQLHTSLQHLRTAWAEGPGGLAQSKKKSLQVLLQAGMMEKDREETERWVIGKLEEYDLLLKQAHICQPEPGFAHVKTLFRAEVQNLEALTEEVSRRLSEAFRFARQCFGEGQETLLLVTDLSANEAAMEFIAANGSPEFLQHSEALAFRRQEETLMEQCRQLLGE